MRRWESFHIEGTHCGALFRHITPEQLLTRIAFPLDESEAFLVESCIVLEDQSWQTMTYWQQPGGVNVSAHRGGHNGPTMPGYGEFLLLQGLLAMKSERIEFEAITDSTPETPTWSVPDFMDAELAA